MNMKRLLKFMVVLAVVPLAFGLAACKKTSANTLNNEETAVVVSVEEGTYAGSIAYGQGDVVTTLSLILENGNYALVYNGEEAVIGAYEFDGLYITFDNGVIAQYIENQNKINIEYNGVMFQLA